MTRLVGQSKSTCPGNQMGRNDKQGPEEADYKKESRGDGGGSAPGGHGKLKKKKERE